MLSSFSRAALAASFIAAAFSATACKSRPVSRAASSAPKPTVVAAAEEPQNGPGSHKRGFGKAAVFVDGKALGVLQRSELPASVSPHMVRRANGRDYPKFWMTEYLAAIGVDVASVKEVHLYGGRAVSVLSGEELRRLRDKIWFSFTRGTAGKPRMEWPDEHVDVNTTIDMIGAIAVYQDRKPPTLQADSFTFAFDGGQAIEGIPYAAPEQPIKGTRVYVDGTLVTAVKRKLLPSSIQRPDTDANPRFSVDGYLRSIGVDPATMKAIDFVSNDDTIARFDSRSFAKVKDTLDFAITRHHQGVIRVSFPESSAGPGPWPVAENVSAIVTYQKTKPPVRELSKTSADVDEPARDDSSQQARQVQDED